MQIGDFQKEEEEILVDLAVGVKEHHHHSLRLLCPARSRPCVNMRMMRMTKMVFDDLSTWSALRAQCFWRDGQVLWRSGCSSSNPEKVLRISFFCFFLQFYLSKVFLVGEVIHQKNFFQKLCRGPKRYVYHHSFNPPCHYFDPDLLITLCMVLSKTDLPSLWKTITTEAYSRANILINSILNIFKYLILNL